MKSLNRKMNMMADRLAELGADRKLGNAKLDRLQGSMDAMVKLIGKLVAAENKN